MKTIFDFRAFLNFLSRNKLYTAINIVGFSVSLTFVILLVCYAQHEFSADRFHANKDRIFRVSDNNRGQFASPIGPNLKNRYPEIEEFIRTCDDSRVTIRTPQGKLQARVLMTDPTFFTAFSFGFSEGNPAQQLQTANEAVISEEFANRVFGTSREAIGKTMEVTVGQAKNLLMVTGIVKDFPPGHLMTPDMILQYDGWMPKTHGGEWIINTDHNAGFGLYLMVKPNTDLPSKTEEIRRFLQSSYWCYQEDSTRSLHFTPLEEVYLSQTFSYEKSNKLQKFGDQKLIVVLSSVALLILIFAMINYVNLSVAQTATRAHEMATRRLLGGTRKELFIRMIIESVILCALSFLFGLLLARAVEPLFNAMLDSNVHIADYLRPIYLFSAIGAVIVLGCATGFVPAAVISNFKPIEVMKGTFKRRTKMQYNRLLIAFQYFITIVLIGCTLTMTLQIRHMTHTNLGYNAFNNLIIDDNADLRETQESALKNEWLRIPGVIDVTACSGVPYDGGSNLTFMVKDRQVSFQEFGGDSSYFKVMGFKILRNNHTQDGNALWLNEAGMKALELADTASLLEYRQTHPIAGIVQDFHFRDLTRTSGPAVLWCGKPRSNWQNNWRFVVRIAGHNLPETYRTVEETYKRFTAGEPFEARFSDQMIQQLYEKQQRTAEILGWLTLIAVVISALGILAMATYFVRQRSMEIAVRKVFGSTNREILKKLIANFVRYVAVAFVIAVPVIWLLMRDWLAQYTSRIGLSWMIFAAAGLTALVIALVTVFGQSWRAANANPVDSIKR